MENIDYKYLYDLMKEYSEGECYTCQNESRTLLLDNEFGMDYFFNNKIFLLNCRNCRRLEFVRDY